MPIIQNRTKHIKLRLVRMDDAPFIVQARLEGSRKGFLTAAVDDISRQEHWLQQYQERERAGSEYYFVIEDAQGNRLGLIRLHNVTADDLVVGSWVIKEPSQYSIAVESAINTGETAFHGLGVSRIFYSVNKLNAKVISFHLRTGAVITHEDEQNVYFELRRDVFEKIWPVKFKRYYL